MRFYRDRQMPTVIVPTPDEFNQERKYTEIRPTIPGKGTGVVARIDIPAFTRVIVYPGIVYSEKQYTRKIFTYAWQAPSVSIQRNRRGKLTVTGNTDVYVDPGTERGNLRKAFQVYAGPYINEPSPWESPNLILVHHYAREPHAAMEYWTGKEGIKRGQELLVCYGGKYKRQYRTSCTEKDAKSWTLFGDHTRPIPREPNRTERILRKHVYEALMMTQRQKRKRPASTTNSSTNSTANTTNNNDTMRNKKPRVATPNIKNIKNNGNTTRNKKPRVAPPNIKNRGVTKTADGGTRFSFEALQSNHSNPQFRAIVSRIREGWKTIEKVRSVLLQNTNARMKLMDTPSGYYASVPGVPVARIDTGFGGRMSVHPLGVGDAKDLFYVDMVFQGNKPCIGPIQIYDTECKIQLIKKRNSLFIRTWDKYIYKNKPMSLNKGYYLLALLACLPESKPSEVSGSGSGDLNLHYDQGFKFYRNVYTYLEKHPEFTFFPEHKALRDSIRRAMEDPC